MDLMSNTARDQENSLDFCSDQYYLASKGLHTKNLEKVFTNYICLAGAREVPTRPVPKP